MFYFISNQKGFAALLIAILILVIMFGIAISLTFLILGQQRISENIIKSNNSYYAAEAGIEDALLRLSRNKQWDVPYLFSVGGSTVEIVISDDFGGTRTVTATGNNEDRFRKIQTVYELSGFIPGLFYGAQVGDGGLIVEGNSAVIGNVFSNGNVELKDPQSEVTETVLVANVGNKIFGKGKVGKEVYVDMCEQVKITGTLHANTVSGCSYGSHTTSGLPISPVPLPIDDLQIEEWKNSAAAGGTIGSYSRNSGIHYLGPVKIDGNLTIENTAQLIITGTIWVTGEIKILNSARLRLDPSYGSASGAIVGNNIITLDNSSISSGSGLSGSYLMYISTSFANPAISIKNSAIVDILYSNTGWVVIENNCSMRSVNAYGIHVKNNAGLTYEIGLADSRFASGPGAGWTVTIWREIE